MPGDSITHESGTAAFNSIHLHLPIFARHVLHKNFSHLETHSPQA
jgi:hypothetical protein